MTTFIRRAMGFRFSLSFFLASALASPLDADTGLTIYSAAEPGAVPAELYRPVNGSSGIMGRAVPGFAIVRDERELDLPIGRSQQRFSDVAAFIDPTTVSFVSLTDPSTRVLEQSFQFDLVNSRKLIERNIGRSVTVERVQGGQVSTTTGTLLSASDGLVLRTADGSISSLKDHSAIRFTELPGGLITRPTLEWMINSQRAGKHRTRVTYETGGITWWSDYNLVFKPGRDANSGTLDLSAWVSIVNLSGASFRDARLKLVAGDLQRAAPQNRLRAAPAVAMIAEAANDAGFSEKAFSEYHLYTLGRRTDLPDNSTRQIELFEQVRQIPAKKLLVYRSSEGGFGGEILDREFGATSSRSVDVFLEFRNDRTNGLGVPLPAGRIRVSQLDEADGSLELIGEDRIDHTPRDERLRIKLGTAFDIVGERRQVDFAIDTRARWLEEEIELTIRNRKDEPAEVTIVESLFRTGRWKIVRQSQESTKLDARQIQFVAKLPKDGEAVVRYRVRYTW
ncbi:MAG: DUF4139 domain-containing protein [Gammaproteobacteria bacterium]